MNKLSNRSETGSSENRARFRCSACCVKAALIVFCVSLLFNQAHADNGQGNIWYFGYGAGLDFNSGSAVVLTDGQINQLEGCATISDNDGNLLFYTDGMSVWNSDHAVMANGTGLLGDPSSTQSAVIVPKPGSSSIFYIFTVPATHCAETDLRYSEVDMTLDDGLGDITTNKNVYVTGPVSEQVTAVVAANGQDIWVITHLSDSDTFHAFIVTSEGISDTPVVSNIGYNHASAQIGYLKSSTSGSRLASASYFQQLAEVYDFDTATGEVSNALSLDVAGRDCYGVEFSPDETLLYITSYSPGMLMQFDLDAGDAAAISTSRVDISITGYGGALQLAPDNKIYLSTGDAYLGAINAPNMQGEGCDYHNGAICLSPGGSGAGLPTFIQSFFIPQSVTTAEVTGITSTMAVCGGTVEVNEEDPNTARGVCWSTDPNPTLDDSHTTDGSGADSFVSTITGLSPNTTYNVRAYATNGAGTVYGANRSFTTAETDPVSLGDDESGGPCFIGTAGEHAGRGTSAALSLSLILGWLILCSLARRSHPGAVRGTLLVLTVGILLSSMALPAHVLAADTAGGATGLEQITFSIGAGYAYVGEDRSADYAGGTSDLEVDYALYPVLRAAYPLKEDCSLELGLRYNTYRWQVRDSISSDTSRDLTAVTALFGPVFYGQNRVWPVLGAGRAFLQSGIGYSIVRTDFNFPVRKYDPAIGGEIAAGFETIKWSCRIGYALFRHDADRTASGFSTDDSNDELDLSGIFIDISYRFDLAR